MTLTENQIDDLTAFAQGEEFASEQEVREYFTVEAMRKMFGRDPDYVPPTQGELDEMAAAVIANRWHMVEQTPVMVEIAVSSETINLCGGVEGFAGLDHPYTKEAADAYRAAAVEALRRDPRASRLESCRPRGQRLLHSQWCGAHWGCLSGAIGCMAADLTEEEQDAISAADDAGREAARKVIAEADAAEAN